MRGAHFDLLKVFYLPGTSDLDNKMSTLSDKHPFKTGKKILFNRHTKASLKGGITPEEDHEDLTTS